MTPTRRSIIEFPGYAITQDGFISRDNLPISATTKRSSKGINVLAVEIEGSKVPVWVLLSRYWYNRALLLPRDGNFLNWTSANTIVMSSVSAKHGFSDPEEIQMIWFQYQRRVISCAMMGQVTGIVNKKEQDFRSLIADILMASIR